MADILTPTHTRDTDPDHDATGSGVPSAAGTPAATTAFADAEVGLFAPLYPLPRIEMVEGQGARVRDRNGREYLDFVSGIAVNALGHAPRGLKRAVAKQLDTLGHVSNLFANSPAVALAKALTEATGYAQVFFCNSGTEGVDTALKFARAHAGANGRAGRDLLAFKGGFHGRTGFALSTTHNPSYREPFLPLIPGIRFADFNDVAGLAAALDEHVAGVIVEPVQGESGAVAATAKFMQALRARCTSLSVPLIFDEVQCGMGRSGRLLAAEHYGVRADMTVLSKALGGGLPLAAVLMSAKIAASLKPGMHGCTFGGNPVSATAGIWMLEQVRKPSFLARVRKRARELDAALKGLLPKHASLLEARGLGLLRAVEVRANAGYDAPALVLAAREEGLLLIRGGERAVRLLPPLNVTTAEIDDAVARLDRALTTLEAQAAARPAAAPAP
ncbi:MAG: aspartate aminotransferase family protein [Candidatus Eisenbacteria bacterium]